jgi:hypothetical protein
VTSLRDLDAQEIAYVHREILAERVEKLQDERAKMAAALASALTWATGQYKQCIISARATTDGAHYEKCNGRAEAYRQLATLVAEASGVAIPDWNGIKTAVPPDGIYR